MSLHLIGPPGMQFRFRLFSASTPDACFSQLGPTERHAPAGLPASSVQGYAVQCLTTASPKHMILMLARSLGTFQYEFDVPVTIPT